MIQAHFGRLSLIILLVALGTFAKFDWPSRPVSTPATTSIPMPPSKIFSSPRNSISISPKASRSEKSFTPKRSSSNKPAPTKPSPSSKRNS